MILLAILATVAAVFWTCIALMADGMMAPRRPFPGGLSVTAAWIVAAVLWAAWWMG